MPKINASNTKGLFITYLVKIILSTVLSVFIFSSLFSFVALKLDLDLKILEYFSVAVCGLSSIVISFISISGFKNNFLILSVISVLPMALFSIINFCVNKQGGFAFELVKLAVIFIFSLCVAVFKSTRRLR